MPSSFGVMSRGDLRYSLGCRGRRRGSAGLGLQAVGIESASLLPPEVGPAAPEAEEETGLHGPLGRSLPFGSPPGLGQGNRGEEEKGEKHEGHEGAARNGTAHGTLLPGWLRLDGRHGRERAARSRVCRKRGRPPLPLQEVGEVPGELDGYPLLLARRLEHEEGG